ncbi:MAG: hypothetical protein C0490_20275, partial [Marivirga sp.]|nr:hypothetical protein [Marivirga sp.]
EKTKGKVLASNVISISLRDIRVGGPAVVTEKLNSCHNGDVCIVNATGYKDLEVLAKGVMDTEKSGKKILYRSSASFVPIRAGMESGKIYIPQKESEGKNLGSLIIVGSHVPKTTTQLAWLLAHGDYKTIEANVVRILNASDTSAAAEAFAKQTDQWILSGYDVVIHTSRALEVGRNKDDSLRINASISDFLVEIIKRTTIRPKFIIAKGGITSSDLASKGLSAEKATVLGPIIPGVPLWKMDDKSKFPGIHYVVFPGNVGDQTALTDVCNRLRNI